MYRVDEWSRLFRFPPLQHAHRKAASAVTYPPTVTVEIFGAPGAGKTSLVREIEHIASRGWRLTPHVPLWRFVMRYPWATCRSLSRLVRRGSRHLRSPYARRLAVLHARQRVATARHRGRPVVFDEGVLKGAYRMQITSDAPLSADILDAFLPATDLVIVLQVSRALAKERIGVKPTHKLGPINAELHAQPITHPAWDRAMMAVDVIVERLPQDRVIYLDASRPLSELSTEVLSLLHR